MPSKTPSPSAQPTQPSDELRQAFVVLLEALDDLSRLGRPATASEARLGLKRRTYDGFDLSALGFRRFREFLDAAAREGHIEIDESRKGDVGVRVPGAIYSSSINESGSSRIRGDIWRAVSDWEGKSTHFVDLTTDAVVSIPLSPVPLEPAHFASVRQRLDQGDPTLIQLLPVPNPRQLEWMHGFALDVRDSALLDALAMADPVHQFIVASRVDPSLRYAWKKALAEHVREYLTDWKSGDPRLVNLALFETAVREGAESKIAARPNRSVSSNTNGLQEPLGQARPLRDPKPPADSLRVIRKRLHDAIDRMPENELREISIPIGYLFDEA